VLYIAEESIWQYSYYLLSTHLIIFYAVLMVDKSYFVIYAAQWDVQDKKKGLGNSHNVAKEVGMCRNRVKPNEAVETAREKTQMEGELTNGN